MSEEEKQTKQVTFRCPAELLDWLEEQATIDHRSLSSQIIFLLNRTMEQVNV